MTATLLPSYARNPHGASEFYQKSPGVMWNGTCMWLALEAIRAAIENRPPSSALMAQMAADALARGYCTAPNGAATLAGVAGYARNRLGYASRILLQYNYAIINGNEEMAIDWHTALINNAGKNGILLQIAHGARLIDIETGVRDEAAVRGLAYHGIAIVGKDVDGYKCVDGDHPQAPTRLQTYAYDLRDSSNNVVNSLRAAVPVGMLILSVPQAPTPPPPPPKPVPPPPPAPDPVAVLKAKLAQIEQIAQSA